MALAGGFSVRKGSPKGDHGCAEGLGRYYDLRHPVLHRLAVARARQLDAECAGFSSDLGCPRHQATLAWLSIKPSRSRPRSPLAVTRLWRKRGLGVEVHLR